MRHAATPIRHGADAWPSLLAALLLSLAATTLLAGCTKREKVVDVRTPAGSIEVYEEKPVTD